jgi:small nuclear ribonucleoprotein (snRNP)-like protein
MASEADPGPDVDRLLEDLEQQAAGLHLAERDAETADRAAGEYARVSFGARLRASLGRQVTVTLQGGAMLEGGVVAVGEEWFAVYDGSAEWVVRVGAVTSARGLSPRAVADPARPAVTRLGLGAALRRVSQAGAEVVVLRIDGEPVRGWLGRVGGDFTELHLPRVGGEHEVNLLPFSAVAAVRAG